MDSDGEVGEPPTLHEAVQFGSLAAVRQCIAGSRDVDEAWWGRTALWEAVVARRHDVALELVEARADPWRVMIGGWSPGRLNLAGTNQGLFGRPPAGVVLSPAERAAVDECERLTAILGDIDPEGWSFACIAGLDVDEAQLRLDAVLEQQVDTESLIEDPWDCGLSDAVLDLIVGVSSVPGGCVVGQWWGATPATPGAMARLTPSTHGYGLAGNPKSGNQGSIFRDGAVVDWDLHPGGGGITPDASPEEVLRTYLYEGNPIAYSCNHAGLRPTDDSAFAGPPDRWLRLSPFPLWPRK